MQHFEPLEPEKLYHISNADRSSDPVGFEEVKWQMVERPTNPTASEEPVGVVGWWL